MLKLLCAAVAVLAFTATVNAHDYSEDYAVLRAIKQKYPTARLQTIATVDDEVSFDIPGKRMACRLDGNIPLSVVNCYVVRGARP